MIDDDDYLDGDLDDGNHDDGEPDDWADDFDYETFVEENFTDSLTNTETKPLWRIVSVVMLAIFLLYAFFAVSG